VTFPSRIPVHEREYELFAKTRRDRKCTNADMSAVSFLISQFGRDRRRRSNAADVGPSGKLANADEAEAEAENKNLFRNQSVTFNDCRAKSQKTPKKTMARIRALAGRGSVRPTLLY
jgi:hypothetical protein